MVFAVNEAAQHILKTVERDEVAIKRCLRYLKGSRDNVLRYTWRDGDADALQIFQVTANTIDEILSWHGFPLMFVSRTQPTKSSSIAEAELSAITTGVASANLVQSILAELDQDVKIRIMSNATAT